MKKFVITILLFLLPIHICMGLLEYGMRSVPNDYSYKHAWLNDNISKVRIWSLGSSHSLYGISPNFFSKPAFNSAHVSQSLKFDEYIFCKYIERADSLEWLILPISYFSIPNSLETGVEWWRVKNYCIYYHYFSLDVQPKLYSEVFGNPLSIYKQIKRVGRYCIHGTTDLYCDQYGFEIDYTKDKRGACWCENGAERAKFHTRDIAANQNIVNGNVISIEKIINLCQAKNVSVLLLNTPVCETYYNNVDSAQYSLMERTCERFAQNYKNVHHLNLFKDDRFNKDDFFDSDHLVIEGAEKLTVILDEYIRIQDKTSIKCNQSMIFSANN